MATLKTTSEEAVKLLGCLANIDVTKNGSSGISVQINDSLKLGIECLSLSGSVAYGDLEITYSLTKNGDEIVGELVPCS